MRRIMSFEWSEGVKVLRTARSGDEGAQKAILDFFDADMNYMATRYYLLNGRVVKEFDEDIKEELRIVCMKAMLQFSLEEIEKNPAEWTAFWEINLPSLNCRFRCLRDGIVPWWWRQLLNSHGENALWI